MDRDILIASIALEEGITLYTRYNETEAARFLQMSPMTLKRRRREGRISCVKTGDRKIAFFGFQLVEYLLDSIEDKNVEIETWASTVKETDSKSATTGSPSSPAVRRGAEHGMTPKLSRQDVLASAQRILKKPSKS